MKQTNYLRRIARQQLLALCMTLDEINTNAIKDCCDSAVYQFESQDLTDECDPCFNNIGRILQHTLVTTDDTIEDKEIEESLDRLITDLQRLHTEDN